MFPVLSTAWISASLVLLAVWGFGAVEIISLGFWREPGGSGGYKGNVGTVLLEAWEASPQSCLVDQNQL